MAEKGIERQKVMQRILMGLLCCLVAATWPDAKSTRCCHNAVPSVRMGTQRDNSLCCDHALLNAREEDARTVRKTRLFASAGQDCLSGGPRGATGPHPGEPERPDELPGPPAGPLRGRKPLAGAPCWKIRCTAGASALWLFPSFSGPLHHMFLLLLLLLAMMMITMSR